MSLDFLPNAGPIERQMAADYAARRARLFNAPVRRVPIFVPVEPVKLVEPVVEPPPAEVEVDIDPDQPVTVWTVMRAACKKHRLTMEQLRSSSRRRDIIMARQECFYAMRHEVPWLGRRMSLPEIAHLFGMDHTTILHGIRQHAKRMEAVQ